MELYDAAVVGGGPAGLNGALYLGRARRRVLLIDSGDARNMAAGVVHNFITNDGVTIADFRSRARAELTAYDVSFRDDEVVSIEPASDHVVVVTKASGSFRCRALLYAAGVSTKLPPVPGIEQLWGNAVFECPYCHAWELRDRSLAVYGGGEPSECLAATLTAWSGSLTYLSDGRDLPQDERQRLAAAGVSLIEDKIVKVSPHAEGIQVVFENGQLPAFGAMFLHTEIEPRVAPLSPWLDESRDLVSVQVDERGRTRLPRLYVAGDAGPNMHQAVMAAASGGLAAMAINSDLIREDRPGSLYDPPVTSR